MKQRIKNLESLHRQFGREVEALKKQLKKQEREAVITGPVQSPITVSAPSFNAWDPVELLLIRTYNGRTFEALPVYLWDEQTPFSVETCVCCRVPKESNPDNQQFVRLSTDNLVVSPPLQDLGQFDRSFFPICDKCADQYPDEFTFNG